MDAPHHSNGRELQQHIPGLYGHAEPAAAAGFPHPDIETVAAAAAAAAVSTLLRSAPVARATFPAAVAALPLGFAAAGGGAAGPPVLPLGGGLPVGASLLGADPGLLGPLGVPFAASPNSPGVLASHLASVRARALR